jgi:hypothetical protein
VQGVTPDIFYGTWTAAGNGDAAENALVRHGGLNDCLTVYGLFGGGDLKSALSAGSGGAIASPGGVGFIASLQMSTPIVTFRSTAHLKLSNGQFSDMRRTVGAQVKFLPFGSERPYDVLRWYNTAWSF